MSIFKVSCPLIPLLPDGEGYPPGFSLPKRQRNEDALNLPQLTKIFRDSLIYESKEDSKLDLCVLGVLSPYSLLSHVMVIELSENRFLPGPESFSDSEWEKLSKLSIHVINSLKHKKNNICCGFNWSPFSWGKLEERGGCQSITTKFHMMIWEWPIIHDDDFIQDIFHEIPPKHRHVFFDNSYNVPFARLLFKTIKNASVFDEKVENTSEFFERAEFTPRGLFLPIKSIYYPEIVKLKTISIKTEEIIAHLNHCIMFDSIESIYQLMKESEKRVLSDSELEILRKNPKIRELNECLDLCQNNEEKEIIQSIYPAILNRANEMNEEHEIWQKCFGFSLVLLESQQEKNLKSGLYIGLHAICGPGGCAEVLGCYLTRPEQRVADETIMINHNHEIWKIKHNLQRIDSLL
ncbi:hypothetical protein TRFO_36828 [Tritrichomonas foetus]|uniref:Uncharacterized protein n=1 Tax=Tritrichomonas foetus TaxID=1144522 RepID=A0A1J4JIJ6_9EUKA|nr:hypothetical protein TRFO_36828 [Tritrichomonas foetus]|eukprot:OHS97020.1 hypothetical protein TRFO_36828 [Tritrichomonas foetus]